MPLVSFEDYMTLKNFVDEFSENVKQAYEGDACKQFNEAATFWEKASIIVSKALYEFISPRQSMNPKARRLMIYADKTVPPLQRAFGEAAMLDALPQESKNEATADLVEWLGGKRIAGLIRQAIERDEGAAGQAPQLSTPAGMRTQP